MQRFFGMMPSSEIAIEKVYKDKYDLTISIQAGEHGWTVLWADGGSNYKDVDDTSENNFRAAYEFAVEKIGELTEQTDQRRVQHSER